MLTDTRIRNAKAKEKPYRLSDGLGLHLEVRPTGSKLWRLRYRLNGKENLYAIGDYPFVTLEEAREERDTARKLVKKGINPSRHRRIERIRKANEGSTTFSAVAKEWLERQADRWTERTLTQRHNALARHVYPEIGSLPVKDVSPALVLPIIQRIERQAPSMAVLVNQTIGAICRFAVSTLRADTDPTQPLRGSLKPRQIQHHRPIPKDELPVFLKAVDEYSGYIPNKIALHLLLLTLARSTEVLGAKWSEFDLAEKTWTVPAERMKMRDPHRIPLPPQAVELLEALRPFTGHREHLFPNRADPRRPVSAGVLWKAFQTMGYGGKYSPHSIRATGSTILNDMRYRPEVVERQLAHAERNKSRAAYNRADYLEERRNMMQAWADYLNQLTAGANVVLMRKPA